MSGIEVPAAGAAISTTLNLVVNKLAPPVIQWYSSVVRVTKDIQELLDQVNEINRWLETTGYEAMVNDKSFDQWLKRLKGVAYAVDDIVDEFQLEAERREAAGSGAGMVSENITKLKSIIFRCKVAGKIKKIKKSFAAIVKQRKDYFVITNSSSVEPPVRLTNMRIGDIPSLPNVDEASVFGRDEDKQQIISMLKENNDQQEIKIISIIGLGGSGKTTLAKLVFNDGEIIKEHFDVRLWVHVSQEFDVRNLIQKMSEAFADNEPVIPTLQNMTKRISDKLNRKRFLLVLDDVWTESQVQWTDFMVYIKGGAPGSRILLTTRNREVAEIVRSTNQFDLPFLSSDDCWKLFRQSLVMPSTCWKIEFEKVGKEIVDKCGGVPLAIKILAGALRGKERIEEWQAVRDNNLSNVIGKDGRVAACLRLSYFHLPSNLKQCFTICSVFPKGHKLDKEQLIDIWIAHDMITLEDGVDYLEYVGHKHFNSLVQMSFLQNVKEEEEGRVTCGMHDLVHDFAQFILGDEISLGMPKEAASSTGSYRNFSIIEQPEDPVPTHIFGKTRAVYFTKCYDLIYGMALIHADHLRSVTVMSPYVTALPETIFQVKNLKYLAMSRLNCEALPESISDLWSLQALHVTDSFYLVMLPESIGKLKKLRTVNLSGCVYLNRLPYSIGDCHMISSIDVSKCRELTYLPESIGKNKRIRVLRLCEANLESLPSSITALESLECLNLRGCDNLVELPKDIGKLKMLQVLDIRGCIKLRTIPLEIVHAGHVADLKIIVVGQGEKFARISELANTGSLSGGVCVMDPDGAHKAFLLKQNPNLRRLELSCEYTNYADEMGIKMNQAMLDGLEPPPGIEHLGIDGYAGGGYAKWMLKQGQVVGDHRVQEVPQFRYLSVMSLSDFPNMKHLEGLVELPRLRHLELSDMPALESISGGPFASLAMLVLKNLPCLGDMWIVVMDTRTLSGGEEGHILIGTCLSDVRIEACPKLMVKPYFPSSLDRLRLTHNNERLGLTQDNEHLLQSLVQGSTSSSSFVFPSSVCCYSLKKLQLAGMTGLGSGPGWELVQHMTALESLEIIDSDVLTELPESLGSLTFLQSLLVFSCSAIRMLPESLGELRSLQQLTIRRCHSLRTLPQSMVDLKSLQRLVIQKCGALEQLPEFLGEIRSLRELRICKLVGLTCFPQSMCGLTSLEEFWIVGCPGIKSLPEWIKDLTALQELRILNCPDLTRRCERGKGEDWQLISDIPDVTLDADMCTIRLIINPDTGAIRVSS